MARAPQAPISPPLTKAQIAKYKTIIQDQIDLYEKIRVDFKLDINGLDPESRLVIGSLDVNPLSGETEPLDESKARFYIERCRDVLTDGKVEPEIVSKVIEWAHAGSPKSRGPKNVKKCDLSIATLIVGLMLQDGIGKSVAVQFASDQLGVSEASLWPYISNFMDSINYEN